jgi:hypothetical protein
MPQTGPAVRVGKDAASNRREDPAGHQPPDALALMPTDRAAFSYQPNDRKSVRLAGLRPERFSLVTLLVWELTDLRSTLRDTFWFKILSLGEGGNSGHGRVYL